MICENCIYFSKPDKDGVQTCAITGLPVVDFIRKGAVNCDARKERGDE